MTTFSILALGLGLPIGASICYGNMRCLWTRTTTGRTANSPSRPAPFFMDTVTWEGFDR